MIFITTASWYFSIINMNGFSRLQNVYYINEYTYITTKRETDIYIYAFAWQGSEFSSGHLDEEFSWAVPLHPSWWEICLDKPLHHHAPHGLCWGLVGSRRFCFSQVLWKEIEPASFSAKFTSHLQHLETEIFAQDKITKKMSSMTLILVQSCRS